MERPAKAMIWTDRAASGESGSIIVVVVVEGSHVTIGAVVLVVLDVDEVVDVEASRA